jgi:hypothetical protein
MPIRVTCPACRRTFRVAEEYAGRRGRCPHCEEPVRVPDEELPLLESLPEDEYGAEDEESPRPRYRESDPRPSPRDHLPAWRRVSLGFLIQQAGAGLNLLALALVISAMTVLAEDPGDFDQEPTLSQTIASSIGALAALFGLVAQITGRFLSASTPVRAPRAIGLVSAVGTALLLPALCAVGGLAILLAAGGNGDEAAVAIVGLGMFGYMTLWTACEATHGFAMGSVGRVLRADGLRTFGRLMGVAVIVGGVLAIFCLCGLGAWADANNPNGQNAAANKAEDKLFLGWLIAASLVTGLYLMLDVVLLQKGRAAVVGIAEPDEDEDYRERWD